MKYDTAHYNDHIYTWSDIAIYQGGSDLLDKFFKKDKGYFIKYFMRHTIEGFNIVFFKSGWFQEKFTSLKNLDKYFIVVDNEDYRTFKRMLKNDN